MSHLEFQGASPVIENYPADVVTLGQIVRKLHLAAQSGVTKGLVPPACAYLHGPAKWLNTYHEMSYNIARQSYDAPCSIRRHLGIP